MTKRLRYSVLLVHKKLDIKFWLRIQTEPKVSPVPWVYKKLLIANTVVPAPFKNSLKFFVLVSERNSASEQSFIALILVLV